MSFTFFQCVVRCQGHLSNNMDFPESHFQKNASLPEGHFPIQLPVAGVRTHCDDHT